MGNTTGWLLIHLSMWRESFETLYVDNARHTFVKAQNLELDDKVYAMFRLDCINARFLRMLSQDKVKDEIHTFPKTFHSKLSKGEYY